MSFADIFKISKFKADINRLNIENNNLRNDIEILSQKLRDLGGFEYYQIKESTDILTQKEKELIQSIENKNSELEKLIKQTKTQTNKLARSKELVKAIDYT